MLTQLFSGRAAPQALASHSSHSSIQWRQGLMTQQEAAARPQRVAPALPTNRAPSRRDEARQDPPSLSWAVSLPGTCSEQYPQVTRNQGTYSPPEDPHLPSASGCSPQGDSRGCLQSRAACASPPQGTEEGTLTWLWSCSSSSRLCLSLPLSPSMSSLRARESSLVCLICSSKESSSILWEL